MKVRALQLGYYGHKRRRPGEIFDLQPVKKKDGSMLTVEQQFSKKWMELVDSKPKKAGKKEVEKEPESEDNQSNAEVI